MAKTSLHCSFCGRSREEVKILIAGQDGHICENCVEHAREIIEQEINVKNENPNSSFKLSVRKPVDIKLFIDEYVIGQDDDDFHNINDDSQDSNKSIHYRQKWFCISMLFVLVVIYRFLSYFCSYISAQVHKGGRFANA